jgi:hypothetical protein
LLHSKVGKKEVLPMARLFKLLRFAALPTLGLAFAGCGHAKLVPAPSAKPAAGASDGAVVSAEKGVRCFADADAWADSAGDLPDFVTPLKVRIVNTSGRAIRVLYEDFVLVGKSGRRYHPIPVVPIGPAAKGAPVSPTYASWNFFVAPLAHASYRTLQPWPRPLSRDRSFYERQYGRWGDNSPPMEVIRLGLPEGVLKDGGVLSGFLFFESPLDREKRVTFEAAFDESDGPENVAVVKIPFRVD